MTRIASVRRSGVDSVTAPVGAETTTEAIADGVKASPAGGELAAALVRLSAVAFARGAMQLSGHVLPPSVGGPGLALTLAKGNGRVIERLTVRAIEFEPPVGALQGPPAGDETDRMLRVATAGAVWTHFKILEEMWKLTGGDIKDSLRTWSWRSYALTRIGIEGEELHRPEVTRALYAKAVEVDPDNLMAQFNLASLELSDDLLALLPAAGSSRLELVHEKLKQENSRMVVERGSPEVEVEQRLLGRDPLCYQVTYKRTAAKLNADVAVESQYEDGALHDPLSALPPFFPQGHWRWWHAEDGLSYQVGDIEGLSLGGEDMAVLTSYVRDLESTLAMLERKTPRAWSGARLKQRTELRHLLEELEGPMLVLWAMVALRVGRPVGSPWPSKALVEPSHPSPPAGAEDDPAPGTRVWLVQEISLGRLTPGEAVAFARTAEVSPSSRTRLNLACWYADINRLAESLSELALAMQASSECSGWLEDEQLRRVRRACGEEWGQLELRHGPPAPAAENGHADSPPSLTGLLVSLMSGRRGG
ncbi:MAG TPA: hypothetical protein VK672_00530 [Solirubrobacteraceae bacterium]|nr:hypothetical protein [Solirubrobacteraceae bacterium]